jgi:integrase
VLDKIRELADQSKLDAETSFRCWLGIRWMTVYVNVRPAEIRDIQEKHIDLKRGEILIPHPKEGKAKKMYLLDEDLEHIRSLPRGMPHLHFFRHKNGDQVGEKFFYKWWMKACKALGVKDVDLYRGTRHSSCQALRSQYTPEEIRLATMHTTDKSFERYYQQEGDDFRRVYRGTADKGLTRISQETKESK